MDKEALFKANQIVNKLNQVFNKDAYKLKAVWDLSTTPKKFVVSIISETNFKIIIDFECNMTNMPRLDKASTVWKTHFIQTDKESIQLDSYIVDAFAKIVDK